MALVFHTLTFPDSQRPVRGSVRVRPVQEVVLDGEQREVVQGPSSATLIDGVYVLDLDVLPDGYYHLITHPDGETLTVVVPSSSPPHDTAHLVPSLTPAQYGWWVQSIRVDNPEVPPAVTVGVVSVTAADGSIDVDNSDPRNPKLSVPGGGSGTVTSVDGVDPVAGNVQLDVASQVATGKSQAIATAETYTDGRITTEATTRSNADNARQLLAEKGQANGYAALDSGGTVPDAQLPAVLARDTEVTAAVGAEASARTAAITAAIAALVNSAPGLMDTLAEIDAALNDDPNFAATMTTALNGKQGLSAQLTALAGLVSAANKLPYFTGAGAAALADFTTFARTLLDDPDATTARTTLGLGDSATHPAADFQPVDADLTTIAALDATTAGVMSTDGGGWIRKTYAQLKTALGLVKADVGLGNVDNTADASKPVSTAQQTALNLKADLASPALTGTPTINGTAVGSAATKNVGTTAGTVAAGNDSRFAGPLPALEGRTGWAFGHSYTLGTGASNSKGWVQRLATRLGFGQTNNGGQAGARMVDAGTYQVSSLWNTLTLPTYGVVYLDCIYNDATDTVSAQQKDGFNNALRAFLNIARSAVVRNYAHAAWTYTGTWSTVADPEGFKPSFAGSTKQTSTSGDTATVDIQGTELCLLLMGFDDTNFGSTGGVVTVTCDGVTVVTGLSLSNRMTKPGSNSRSRSYVPVRITGLNPGYHRIAVTKTDTTGSLVQISGAVAKADNPPYIVLLKEAYTPGVTTAMDYFNGQLDVIAAEFDAKVMTLAPPAGWVPASHIGVDGIHPDDQGHEQILNNVYAQAGSLPDAVGISNATYLSVPVTLGSDDFNRADNTATLGSTSVGALPWRHVYANSRWGIASNTAACQTSVTDSAVEVETGKADATVTATLTTGSGNNVGLRFRGTSDGVGLVWFNTGGLFQISAIGTIASVGTTVGTYTTGDTVQVVCSGQTLVFKKNGSTVSTQTIANQAGGTRHGLHGRADTTARWDNFSVA